jgi:hypothetical protein
MMYAEYYAPFWRDIIVNYGLEMPKARMFFTLQDAACASLSYCEFIQQVFHLA